MRNPDEAGEKLFAKSYSIDDLTQDMVYIMLVKCKLLS